MTWIPRIATAAALVAVYAPIACVNSNQEGVETTKTALGTFSAWQNLSTPLGQDGAPTIAQVYDTQVAFAASGPLGASALTVNWTSRKAGGPWSAWTGLLSSTADFKERPAAVAFDVPTDSPLAGTIALVGRKTDNTYYVRIQTPTPCAHCGPASIVQNWHQIGGIWISPPALAFIPANSATGPRNTLALVGLGLDSRYWYMENTLTAQNGYSPSNWAGPFPLGLQTFDSPPALTYPCTPGASLILAGVTGSTMLFNSHNGMSFHPWNTSDGAFLSGPAPALAAGCFGEVTAYGVGTNSLIHVSRVVDTVPTGGWTPISLTPTFSGVSATAGLNAVTVTGKTGTGTAPDFQAMFTSVASPACALNDFCAANAFCERQSNGCTATVGVCTAKPTSCPATTPGSCGCDGKTYANDCERDAAGVSKMRDGRCSDEACPSMLPSQGTSCSPEGTQCMYTVAGSSCIQPASCTNGVWSLPAPICNF